MPDIKGSTNKPVGKSKDWKKSKAYRIDFQGKYSKGNLNKKKKKRK